VAQLKRSAFHPSMITNLPKKKEKKWSPSAAWPGCFGKKSPELAGRAVRQENDPAALGPQVAPPNKSSETTRGTRSVLFFPDRQPRVAHL